MNFLTPLTQFNGEKLLVMSRRVVTECGLSVPESFQDSSCEITIRTGVLTHWEEITAACLRVKFTSEGQ